MVKVEAEHQVLGFDRLVAILEERRATSFDIPTSLTEFVEEINLAGYIQAMLVNPTLEARAATSTDPLTKPTTTPLPLKASHIPIVDKGKGTYVSPPKKKKALLTKPTEIVIGTSVTSVPSILEEEEEPISGDVNITLPPAEGNLVRFLDIYILERTLLINELVKPDFKKRNRIIDFRVNLFPSYITFTIDFG